MRYNQFGSDSDIKKDYLMLSLRRILSRAQYQPQVLLVFVIQRHEADASLIEVEFNGAGRATAVFGEN